MAPDGKVISFQDRLGQALVEAGFLTPEALSGARDAARRETKRLTDILIEQRLISREVLTTALSFQFKVPVINLKGLEIKPDVLKLVSEEFARQREVLPVAVSNGGELQVAMENPNDFEAINTLSAMTRRTIRPVLPLDARVKDMVEVIYTPASRVSQQLAETLESVAEPITPAPPARSVAITEDVTHAPVVRAVDMIALQAVKSRASDIHLVPTIDSAKVLYRVDGVLHQVHTLPLEIHQNMVSRIKVMAKMDITEKRRPQDGSFSLTFGEREINFRVACVQSAYGEVMVIRVLDKGNIHFDVSELGLTGTARQAYQRLLTYPLGMIAISGPTGSGKTTTLYASLYTLADGKRNIMTVEDPIEYRFENITQIETNPAAGIDFPSGLRAIMRMDPDIILVGEVRDKETATVAIQAANTGHLVLSSIHANDSASSITRFLDLGVEPFSAATGIIGIVAQRLVRKICPQCKTPAEPTAVEAIAYEQEMQESAGKFYAGQGCNACSFTGYQGRIGVFEVLVVTEEIRSLIVQRATSSEIKREAMKQGMVTMHRDGMLKVKEGITTVGEVMRAVFTTA
ncbi:MAG: type II/IV secretion system protein [Chloroflexi bacterium]|nr:type II/IV secretion system protein [Chloroflexota bacterium]